MFCVVRFNLLPDAVKYLAKAMQGTDSRVEGIHQAYKEISDLIPTPVADEPMVAQQRWDKVKTEDAKYATREGAFKLYKSEKDHR